MCIRDRNSNSWNRYQTEGNIKITAQNMKRRFKYHSKYKRRHEWTNLKRIKTDCNYRFLKLDCLRTFQISFFCNVDIMLIVGIQICLTEAFTFLTCKCGFHFSLPTTKQVILFYTRKKMSYVIAMHRRPSPTP